MHHLGSPKLSILYLMLPQTCFIRESRGHPAPPLYEGGGREDFCSVGIGNREYKEEGDTSGEDADIPQPHTRWCLLLTGPPFAS